MSWFRALQIKFDLNNMFKYFFRLTDVRTDSDRVDQLKNNKSIIIKTIKFPLFPLKYLVTTGDSPWRAFMAPGLSHNYTKVQVKYPNISF